MAHRLIGEFRPPPELAAMSVARVTGKGTVETTPGGLRIDGRVLAALPQVPRVAWSLLVLGALLIVALVPNSERVLVPGTTLVVVVVGFFYWRAEYGLAGAVDVPWTDVEHVVRLASAKEVVAIVLSRPLKGWGSPETLYFAPSLGVEALAAAFHAEAPEHVTMDLESGLRSEPAGPTDDAD